MMSCATSDGQIAKSCGRIGTVSNNGDNMEKVMLALECILYALLIYFVIGSGFMLGVF